MNVISLFNGMGTLRQALADLNIKVGKYYSSEIKPYANELQQYHFPDVIQVGSILNWKQWNIDWKTIDFVGSGSPCQDLSIAGKRAGINGSRSSLFWVFIEILNHIKKLNPNVLFLQENVGSASKLDIGIMSRALGLYPTRINSKLLTAQLRDRYYWTNIKTKQSLFDTITDIPQPKDKGIMLKDIIENGKALSKKHCCLTERYFSAYTFSNFDSVIAQKYLYKRFKYKGLITLIEKLNGKYRLITQNEAELLQGFPSGYTNILNITKAGSLLGDGWTLPVIIHILQYMKK